MSNSNTNVSQQGRTGGQTSLDDNWGGSDSEGSDNEPPAVHRAAAVRTTRNTSGTSPRSPLEPGVSTVRWGRHRNAHRFPVDLSRLLNPTQTWSRAPNAGSIPDLSSLLSTPSVTWERHWKPESFPPDFSSLLSTTDSTSDPVSSKREPMKPVSSYASTSVSDTQVDTDTSSELRRVPANDVISEPCPECGGEIIQETGDQYCGDCGLLLVETEIDTGPEWRAFNSREQDERSRVGGPVRESMHDKGLSTVIGSDTTDAMGQPIKHSQKKKMDRLRTWDDRYKVQGSQERNMRQAFGEIQRVSSEVDLPEYVVETASTVYRRALEEELIPGRSIEAMATASVYIAIRQANIPKTVDEVVQYSRVDDDRVTAAYSYISRELGLEIKPPQVQDHLAPIASELGVSSETEQKAREILETAIEGSVHSGKSPSGLAASAVYAATIVTQKDSVTQEQASNAGDVCKLTIRSRYRELLETIDVDVDSVTAPSISG